MALQALNIAVTARALVHQTTKQTPLLKSLRPEFFDLPIVGIVLATRFNPLRLPLMLQVSSQEPHLRLITELGKDRTERLPLRDWWEGPFVALPETGFFSRRDVVVGLADKEAAHVDVNITANFKRLIDVTNSRGRSVISRSHRSTSPGLSSVQWVLNSSVILRNTSPLAEAGGPGVTRRTGCPSIRAGCPSHSRPLRMTRC
jgi:hypothetical protein